MSRTGIINLNKISTAAKGILNEYNAYDIDTLVQQFYCMAENDMEVLFEDRVINSCHKSIWKVINKLADAGLYDQTIMDYVVSNQFIKITRIDMDEEIVINIMSGKRVFIKVTVDGELYVNKEFNNIEEYIALYTESADSSYADDVSRDLMAEHYGSNI